MIIDFEKRRKRQTAKNRLHQVKPLAKIVPLRPIGTDELAGILLDSTDPVADALADLKRAGYTFPGGLDKILQPDSE